MLRAFFAKHRDATDCLVATLLLIFVWVVAAFIVAIGIGNIHDAIFYPANLPLWCQWGVVAFFGTVTAMAVIGVVVTTAMLVAGRRDFSYYVCGRRNSS